MMYNYLYFTILIVESVFGISKWQKVNQHLIKLCYFTQFFTSYHTLF